MIVKRRNWSRRKKWSRRIILTTIQKLHQDGRKLSCYYMQKHPREFYRALYFTACRYFGNWKDAIKAAGIDYRKIRVRQPLPFWTRKIIAHKLKDRYYQGLPLNSSAILREDPNLYQAIWRIFGKKGFTKALCFSGFSPKVIYYPKKWTLLKVKDEILKRWQLGLSLSPSFFIKRGERALLSAGEYHLGSWRKAIEFSGLFYEKVMIRKNRWWTKRRVLEKILFLEKQGERLSPRDMNRKYGDLTRAATKYFGGWTQALHVAGIDHRQHYERWSYLAWIRTTSKASFRRINRNALKFANKRRRLDAKST